MSNCKIDKIQESLIAINNNLENVSVNGSENIKHLLTSMVGIRDLIGYINEIKSDEQEVITCQQQNKK